MIDLKIGDKIVYDCAVQKNAEATVTNIDIAKNAAGNHIPWLTLEFVDSNKDLRKARIAGISTNLKMMKVCKVA